MASRTTTASSRRQGTTSVSSVVSDGLQHTFGRAQGFLSVVFVDAVSPEAGPYANQA